MSDNTIAITRPTISTPIPPPQKAESRFRHEVINIPSQGWFYPADNPLSSGQIDLKMMNAHDEDILTSPNMIQKGIVLDKLLESVVVNEAIPLDDMLVCDRNAAF